MLVLVHPALFFKLHEVLRIQVGIHRLKLDSFPPLSGSTLTYLTISNPPHHIDLVNSLFLSSFVDVILNAFILIQDDRMIQIGPGLLLLPLKV